MTGRAFLLVPERRDIPLLVDSFAGSSVIVGCRRAKELTMVGSITYVGRSRDVVKWDRMVGGLLGPQTCFDSRGRLGTHEPGWPYCLASGPGGPCPMMRYVPVAATSKKIDGTFRAQRPIQASGFPSAKEERIASHAHPHNTVPLCIRFVEFGARTQPSSSPRELHSDCSILPSTTLLAQRQWRHHKQPS